MTASSKYLDKIINHHKITVIIDPNEIGGGDPMYDLAFSQINWNYPAFSKGVSDSYIKTKPLSNKKQERFAQMRIYLQYWSSLMSYKMGWDIWKKLLKEYYKIKLNRSTSSDGAKN